MVKQFGGLNLICVTIAHKIDVVMKNKPFYLNSGSSSYYCVKDILYTIMFNTTSLVTAMLCC